jgi:glycosyltransferase involved in cell wall biosynthesis
MKKILLIDDDCNIKLNGAPLFKMEHDTLLTAGFDVYTIDFDKYYKERVDGKDFQIDTSTNKIQNKVDKFFGSSKMFNEIKTIIKQIKPDIIHLHLISKYPIPLFQALPDDIPIIQTLHGPNYFCPTSWGVTKESKQCNLNCGIQCVTNKCIPFWQYPIIKSLFTKLPKLLDKVTLFHCPSKNIELVANKAGYKNTKIIPLGLRKEFSNIKLKTIFEGYKLLFIGSLHPVKGLDVLLKSMKILIKKNSKIQLYIAGKGAYEEYYKQKVKEYNLSNNVNFLGFVDSNMIIKTYQSVDITIVPSIWSEQFGMVGPESLACGVPVIGSNIGGIPEWLENNKHGILVEPNNYEQLSEKIYLLLENKDLLLKYGLNGYKYINEHFSYENYEKNILSMIEEEL